jgi:uncharacterized protein YecE (DUF72 family)
MPRARRGAVRVGCSGWQYAHWRGRFYPEDVPTSAWLERYAKEFDTVELNGTFYRLPEPATVRTWRARVPASFCFAWKASRFLTHNKKLKDPREPLARMMASARELGSKLGPILFQLPPRWECNLERLRELIEALPRGRYALELRNPTWYDERVLELLDRSRVALCLHDMPGSESGRREVGPFVYARFHGSGERYGGGYGAGALASWARWLATQANAGRDVYAYFNNDAEANAPRDAAALREAIARAS